MNNYANEPAENLFFSDLPYRSEQLDFKRLYLIFWEDV